MKQDDATKDEAATETTWTRRTEKMATPRREIPPVVIIRPTWLDLPIYKLTWLLSKAAIAAIPAMTMIYTAWRMTNG